MKFKLSQLALATVLFISTTAYAQEQVSDAVKLCIESKVKTRAESTSQSHCLGVVSQRVNAMEAQVALAVAGAILDDLSVETVPLKMSQAADGKWLQSVAGRETTTKISPNGERARGSISFLKVHFLADADANAVSIRWRFASGLDAEGKRIEYDTTTIVKLEDTATSNVTTITPAK